MKRFLYKTANIENLTPIIVPPLSILDHALVQQKWNVQQKWVPTQMAESRVGALT